MCLKVKPECWLVHKKYCITKLYSKWILQFYKEWISIATHCSCNAWTTNCTRKLVVSLLFRATFKIKVTIHLTIQTPVHYSHLTVKEFSVHSNHRERIYQNRPIATHSNTFLLDTHTHIILNERNTTHKTQKEHVYNSPSLASACPSLWSSPRVQKGSTHAHSAY